MNVIETHGNTWAVVPVGSVGGVAADRFAAFRFEGTVLFGGIEPSYYLWSAEVGMPGSYFGVVLEGRRAGGRSSSWRRVGC